MLNRKDFRQPLYFQNQNDLTGSDGLLRFRMTTVQPEDEEENRLQVTVWPGPYGQEATPDSVQKTVMFPLTEEGLCEAVDWLNTAGQKHVAAQAPVPDPVY